MSKAFVNLNLNESLWSSTFRVLAKTEFFTIVFMMATFKDSGRFSQGWCDCRPTLFEFVTNSPFWNRFEKTTWPKENNDIYLLFGKGFPKMLVSKPQDELFEKTLPFILHKRNTNILWNFKDLLFYKVCPIEKKLFWCFISVNYYF